MIEKLPFANHPAFKYDMGLEGYRDFTFGGRAGPESDIDNVFHEIAHAVEFGSKNFKKRAGKFGFVFKRPKLLGAHRYGLWYEDPKDDSATQRELRTFAIQAHLFEMVGGQITDEWLDEKVNVAHYMPDWFMVFGEEQEDRDEFIKEMIQLYYQDYNKEDIVDEMFSWLDKTESRLHEK